VPRGVNKCPQCGASVSQFAAGCAICGADLVAARAGDGETLGDRLGRLEPEFLRSAETRRGIVLVAIVALVVAFLPIAGLLLAGFIAFMRHRDGDSVMRNIMLALAVFALWELTSLENQGGIGWYLL
jgi:hypothetical protein